MEGDYMTIELFIPENLKLWTRPSCYIGVSWPDYYVFLGRHRDSNALDRANFDAALASVKNVMSKDSIPADEDESATVTVVSENHWAVGWVEWIAIHKSDEAALREADRIAAALQDYPVVDEMMFSQYESDEANEIWANCYDVSERVAYIRKHRSQFDFRDYADMLNCVRGKYFAGYASELIQ